MKLYVNFNVNLILILIFGVIFAQSCNSDMKNTSMKKITPPVAEQKPYQHSIHNDIRMDEYYWLKDKDNPEVIDYLERENDYYEKATSHTVEFQNELFEEMKARIKEDDSSVPYFYNGYWYVSRYEKGKEYPIYTRKRETLDTEEEILFDCNELSKGHEYFRLVGISISPDNTKAAFAIDTVSRRQYTLKVKDLVTGKLLDTSIENTTGGSVWAKDNETLFYTQKDPITLRSEAIYRHNIYAPNNEKNLVYEEEDDTFSVYVMDSKSEDYIFISSYSTLTTEFQYIKSDEPLGDFKYFQKRIRGLEYSISHFEDNFYVFTNADDAENYKIMKTPVNQTERSNWVDFVDHRPQVLLEDLEIFKEYFAITERENGLTKIRIQSWDGLKDFYLPIEGETYSLYASTNVDFNTTKLRYVFNSMTSPSSVREFDMANEEHNILKEQEVLGDFDKNNYTSDRLWATAEDGVKIPISIVHHKETELNSNTPILLYAYGSYGSTIDPNFSTTRLSLLNRGFAFAIAHIRGGEYMGRNWYDDGKLFNKKNTFSDFISSSKFLIEEGMTSSEHLYAYGGSAGGLLMGVILNDAPKIYNGVISAVPFVDVVTTMLDDTIPLTTSEYDEWGNPNDKEYYHYIKSYSPYDNVKVQDYPNILVTTGLHDSQVQYWEPAKWVARLRKLKTDNKQLYLNTNMNAGHSGASGRFDPLHETAKKYSFLLELENKFM
jgi:oligopeptidase B